MKDEEMAEEWWNNWIVKDWNDIKEGKRLFIQAFLAGLKARLQWHDLEKDPTDLPKVNGQYWVCYEDSVNIGRKGHEIWIFINGKWEHTAKVIAWCEIPTFDKE